MKKPYYTIKIVANHFSISLHKNYAKRIYNFADHLEFSLKLYELDITFVSRDTMVIRGTFNNAFISLERAIIEQVNVEFSERAGGTGKGVLYKALREMCNRDIHKDRIFVRIDGDSFDKKNERRYSDVDVDTQICCIDDLKKSQRPDTFITDITEGVSVRKMYADSFYQRVKFLITTNYAPNFDNASDKRRAKIFELSNYYSDVLRPSDEFQKWFFGNEWDCTDWNEFYSFMIRCANEYIQNGISEVSEVNYSNRVILENTSEDFVYWFEEQIINCITERKEKMFLKDSFYSSFSEKYGENFSAYKKPKNKFFEWVRLYCRKKSYPYSEFRSTTDEFYIFPTSETMKKCLAQKGKKDI